MAMYRYRDSKRAGGSAPASSQAPAPRRVPVPPAVARVLQDRDARIKELKNELDSFTENYDTLAGINEGLTQALVEMTARAEKAEAETQALKIEAEQTTLTKVLEEELAAERAKNTELLAKTNELRSQLTRSRRKVEEAHKAAATHQGAAITITTGGIELHGTYQQAPTEHIQNTLNHAFEILVRKTNDRHIASARR